MNMDNTTHLWKMGPDLFYFVYPEGEDFTLVPVDEKLLSIIQRTVNKGEEFLDELKNGLYLIDLSLNLKGPLEATPPFNYE